jgi:hypothetical protein
MEMNNMGMMESSMMVEFACQMSRRCLWDLFDCAARSSEAMGRKVNRTICPCTQLYPNTFLTFSNYPPECIPTNDLQLLATQLSPKLLIRSCELRFSYIPRISYLSLFVILIGHTGSSTRCRHFLYISSALPDQLQSSMVEVRYRMR